MPADTVRQCQLLRGLQRLMSSFVDKLFTKKSFEASHVLSDNVDDMKDKRILMPDGTRSVQTVFCEAGFGSNHMEMVWCKKVSKYVRWFLNGTPN